MRALLLAPMKPSRSGNGLALRIQMFAEALERIADLDIVIVPVSGGASLEESDLRASLRRRTINVELDTHFKLLTRLLPKERRLEAFRQYGRPSVSAALSVGVLGQIRQIAASGSYDLIHVARSYMMPAAEVLPPDVRLSLDLDEDDWTSTMSQSRIARQAGDFFRAEWLKAEAEAFDKLILRYCDRFSAFFISSHVDQASLRSRLGLTLSLSNNAVAPVKVSPRADDGETLGFVGSLGYEPNVEGLQWFMRMVAPRIAAQRNSGFKLLLAGYGDPARLSHLCRHPRVQFLGAVKNVATLYNRATLAIAPMRMGGGTRTKIIEAAMHGLTCVAHNSCGTAMSGSPQPAGWTASNPQDFAAACIEALQNTAERRKREKAARRFALQNYDRQKVIQGLEKNLRAVS